MKAALIRRLILLFGFFFFISFLSPCMSHATVIAFDSIALIGKPVMLKAQTKRFFFPQGGRIVDFYINEKNIGRTLSGGDGYAFLEYIPQSDGLKKVEVRSGDDQEISSVLVMRRKDRVILVEIEGGLLESVLSDKPKEGSKEAIKGLLGKYRIIYITTMFGLKISRKWLEDKNISSSVVLKYTGTELFNEINQLGIRMYAIIGSPELLSDAPEYIKKRYTFEETEDGVEVKDWEEIVKLLN